MMLKVPRAVGCHVPPKKGFILPYRFLVEIHLCASLSMSLPYITEDLITATARFGNGGFGGGRGRLTI